MPDECPHCRSGPEIYWYLGLFEFDVDKARTLVDDGREAVEVDEASVAESIENSEIFPEHIEHVDTRYPGIIAHVWAPDEQGQMQRGHILIDGNHRAARCQREGIPFYAYILTEAESESIMLMKPDALKNQSDTH